MTIDRVIASGALAALIGGVSLVLGALLDPAQAAASYLTAFLFGVSLALGALLLLTFGYAARARWFVVLRRLTEIVASTLPVFAVLFVPILLALPQLYPWARPLEGVQGELREALEHQRIWLSPAFFTLRAALVFSVWIFAAEGLIRGSLHQGEHPEAETTRLRAIGVAVIWPLALTLTIAAFDWIMSLSQGWISTIFGVYLFGAAVLGALALLAVLAALTSRGGVLADQLSPSHFYATGRLLQSFVLLWGYFAFVQLLIVWMADLPREVDWYLVRSRHGWDWLSGFLIVGRFAIPFALLLSYPLKRNPVSLGLIGGWILIGHYADLAWLVLPALHPGSARPHLLDLAALVAVSGAAVAFGAARLRGRAAVPEGDPELATSLRYEST